MLVQYGAYSEPILAQDLYVIWVCTTFSLVHVSYTNLRCKHICLLSDDQRIRLSLKKKKDDPVPFITPWVKPLSVQHKSYPFQF